MAALPVLHVRDLEMEETLGVTVGEGRHLCFVEIAGDGVEEVAAAGVGAEGIVDREEEMVETNDFPRAAEGLRREIAAGGEGDVALEVLGNGAGELRCGREDAARTSKRVGETFAHVADDELKFWQAIEEAGDDESEQMQGSLGVPAPAGDRQQVAEVAGQAAEVGLPHSLGRWRGMEIDRHIQRNGRLEDGGEAWIIEEEAVGGAVEHGALEAMLRDTAGELCCCLDRLLQAERGEAGETSRIGAKGGGELVVDVVREQGRGIGRQGVEADGGKRKNLQVDAGGVHGGYAAGAEIQELCLQLLGLRGVAQVWTGGAEEAFRNEVLFKGDGSHGRFDVRNGRERQAKGQERSSCPFVERGCARDLCRLCRPGWQL